MEGIRNSITRLNNQNFYNWKFRMEMILRKEKLWEVIVEEEPAENNERWRQNDCQARSIIGLLVEDDQLVHIRNCESSKEMWSELQKFHERTNLSSTMRNLRKLYSAKLAEGQSIKEHTNKIKEQVSRLRSAGEKIPDKHIIAILLGSLPANYDGLVTALETREEGELTLEYAVGKLVDEEEKRNEHGETQRESELALRTRTEIDRNRNQTRLCFQCNQAGHLRRDCRENRYRANYNRMDNYSYENRAAVGRGENKREENSKTNPSLATGEDEYIAFLGLKNNGEDKKDEWIIDSGASNHMGHNKTDFYNLRGFNKNPKIILADGKCVEAQGQGDVKIQVVIYDSVKTIILKDVLWIPELSMNLLSVKRVCQRGYRVEFKGNNCNIMENKNVLAQGTLRDTSFILIKTVQQIEVANNACIHEWHQRLGHRDIKVVKEMVRPGNVYGVHSTKCDHEDFCRECELGSRPNQSYSSSSTGRPEKPAQVLCADLCGPITPISTGGNKYFLTVTDIHSRYVFTEMIPRKDSVNRIMKDIVRKCKNRFGYYPRIIRTDNGGEFENLEINNFYAARGIEHQTTVPYCSAQNGMAERNNRTLLDIARRLLITSGLRKQAWGEAVNTAGYLHNRTIHTATGVTPYELWEGIPPHLGHLQVFGSVTYFSVPQQQRSKLDNVRKEGVFLGYCSRQKGYRVMDLISGKVISTRSAVFNTGYNKTRQDIDILGVRENVESLEVDKPGKQGEAVPMMRKSTRENFGRPPSRWEPE